ncbi:MAG: hypothetical protein GX442_25380 [Candidatus Riflebacteria bacterium]|nr:hypothetical protein [Candidatus Riflebacteria bacterium]
MNDLCARFLDRLLQEGEPEAEVAAHLAACPACAATREAALAVRRQKRLLDPAPPDLTGRILQAIPSAPTPNGGAANGGAGAASFGPGLGSAVAAGAFILALAAGSLIWGTSPGPAPTTPPTSQGMGGATATPILPAAIATPATGPLPIETRPASGPGSLSLSGPDQPPD